MGVLPTLQIDGHHLVQSLPIIEYLEERNPNPPLLPKDLYGRAQVRAIAEMINSGIQPFQNEYTSEEKKEFAVYNMERGLFALEAMLEKTAGKYCYGDTITMADVFLVPQVFGGNRAGVDVSQFPTASRINEALLQLPAFQSTHPLRQPDTPEDQRPT